MTKLLIRISLVTMVFYASLISAQIVANEHSIKFENPTTATLVGEDGLIMKTTNNGVSWSQLESNLTNALYGNSIKNGISVAVGENGVILRSSDLGVTWDVILPGTLSILRDVELLSNNHAVVCGDNGLILVSDDAGLSWDSVFSGTPNDLIDVKFTDEFTGYATGEQSTVIKSTDGGITWEVIDMSFTVSNFKALDAINPELVFVVGDNGSIFASENGGITWYSPTGTGYETNLNDIVFFDSLNGVIAGDNGFILKSTDAGYSWVTATTLFSGDDYDFLAVAFADVNNGITVGKTGVQVYTTDGGDTWTETAPILYPNISAITGSKTAPVKLEQNYPNPFNPSTNISYTLPYNASVSLKVYDMTGREVANLVNAQQTKGSYSVSFSASNLASGVYFYKLNVISGNVTTNKVMRMILTK